MKHALVCFGNEESYGLYFVGGELQKLGQEIKFFDAETDGSIVDDISNWKPNYVLFSPMTTFFPQAYEIATNVKKKNPDITSVFGGIMQLLLQKFLN